MLKCSTCNAEQDSGKFCGVCGGHLEAIESGEDFSQQIEDEQAATTQSIPVQPDVPQAHEQPISAPQQNSFEIQKELGQYWTYVLDLLKNPTKGLQLGESQFIYGIINLALYVITFSLSIYTLFNTIFKNTFGLLSDIGMFGDIFNAVSGVPKSLPFGTIVFQTGTRGIILIIIAFASLFVFSKLMTNRISFKGLVAQYGGVITPLLALNILAIFIGLLGSASLSSTLIIFSIIFTMIITPALIVFEKGAHLTNLTQKVYFGFGASAVALIGLYLVIKNAMTSLFGGLTDFMGMLNYLS